MTSAPWRTSTSLCRRFQPPVDLKVVAGADHFFGGREKELYSMLKDYPFPLDPDLKRKYHGMGSGGGVRRTPGPLSQDYFPVVV